MSSMSEALNTSETIRVLLVDDQTLLRDSFRRLLELEGDGITVVGAAADGLEALAAIERLEQAGHAPHVVLMDVRMPRLDGVGATKQIVARWPDIRVMMLTTFDDDEYFFEGLQAGARGYLLKDVTSDELVKAVRDVYRGESPIQPSMAAKLVARLTRPQAPSASPAMAPPAPGRGGSASGMPIDELTDREREILKLIARGDNNREIGETLFITEGTVKNHVSNILSKLALRDRTQAALWAREHGLA